MAVLNERITLNRVETIPKIMDNSIVLSSDSVN